MSAFYNVDNEGTLVVAGVNIDSAAPTVVFNGAQATYLITETIAIDCVATDELSGIATADCPDLNSAAAELGTGTYTLSATVDDIAGNTTTESTQFEVVVTPESLSDLVENMLSIGGGGNGGLINSLITKIDDGNYDAFINEVEAKCCLPAAGNGKKFTAEQAQLLIDLATELAG